MGASFAGVAHGMGVCLRVCLLKCLQRDTEKYCIPQITKLLLIGAESVYSQLTVYCGDSLLIS